MLIDNQQQSNINEKLANLEEIKINKFPPQKNYSKKILLIWPGRFNAFDPDLPNSLFFLSKPLIAAGYEPVILDMQIKNYEEFDYSGYLFYGISSMSGPQLGHAVNIAKLIRQKAPGFPIVWGGDHVGQEAESTVKSGLCDYAVRGEAEKSIVDLANGFYNHTDLSSVPGLTTIINGKMINNCPGEFIDYSIINHLPFHLVDLKSYPGMVDKFPYLSSKGCPFTCSFCTWKGNRLFRAKPPEVVVDELAEIAAKYGPKTVTFIDALFFARVDRVKRIAELLIERDLPIEIYAMCRVDLFERVSDEMLAILKKAKFNEIAFGGESGSDKQLVMMSKKTTQEQLLKSAERCKKAGILPTYSFLLGLPDELDEHVPMTLNTIDKLKQLNPDGRANIMAIFDPYPGAEYTDLVIKKYGFVLPKTLEEYAKGDWLRPESKVWIPKEKHHEYNVLQSLVRYFYVWDTLNQWDWKTFVARHNGSRFFALVSYVAHASLYPFAKFRWKRNYFKLGYEMIGWRKTAVALRGHE
ncbi:MAG: radical SAM protein [Bacteriovoracaceae bacterium]